MSVLDEIIAGATDDAVSTANLLRKVVVICHRLGAEEARRWAESELSGYDLDEPVPSYRGPMGAIVSARYAGPGGSSATTTLSSIKVPDWFQQFFQLTLRQPLAELEVAAAASEDPTVPWPAEAIGQWNRWEADGTVPSIEFMNVLFAHTVVSRMAVRGVIDRIRNTALAFALDLQRAFPDAGEPGGPTVIDSGVQQVIHSITNNIYGDSNNLAVGPSSNQSTKVAKGDLVELLRVVRALGVPGGTLDELASVMASSDPPEIKRSKAQAIADRIRSGSVSLASATAAGVAAEGIIEAVGQFLG